MSEGWSVDVGSVRREGSSVDVVVLSISGGAHNLTQPVLYNNPGTGSASMTVHGSSLGLVAFTARVRSGQTECEGTDWESETS
jgi:hypothetical protein